MANLVFTPCTGAAEIKRNWCPEDNFLRVTVDGTSFSDEFILTGCTLELAGNYQFLHTVNDFVYFYAFGDRVGSLSLTGIGFINPCDNVKKARANILSTYNYYVQNRSYARGGRAVTITLSAKAESVSLHGFLTGARIDISDNQQTGAVGYWTYRFEVLPQNVSG